MWKLFALEALRAGHAVAVGLPVLFAQSEELDEFRRLGGVLFPYQPLNWLMRRMASQGCYSRFGKMRQWAPDILCVSLGAPCDIFWQKDLLTFLRKNITPQVYIVQCNAEGIIKGDHQRKALHPLYANAAKIICVSHANALLLERQFASRLPNTIILPNPIRSRLERPLPWPDDKSDMVRFATVARYEVECKCQDQILEAFATSAWNSRNWHLDLFGGGPDKTYLQDLISYYGLENNVTIKGYERDIKKIWSGHHIHILISRAEGLTLALIESMFCGRPAIINRAGGNHELSRDGLDGFISPGLDLEVIQATLERAWASRGKWKDMGESAFLRANGWVPKDLSVRLLETITGTIKRTYP